MDEVSVQPSSLKTRIYTRRKHNRFSYKEDHLTVALTSCIKPAPRMLPPYVLFHGDSFTAIPTDFKERNDVWPSFQANGWMDTDSFRRFIVYFGDHLTQTYQNQDHPPDGIHVLFVDNHSSRLDPTMLLTAWCKYRILILTGPALLTHIWQPNDRLVNRMFKVFMRRLIASHLACDFDLTLDFLVRFSIEICSQENVLDYAEYIVSSWLCVGLVPFDRSRIEGMIDHKAEESRAVDAIVTLAMRRLREMLISEKLIQETLERDAADAKKRNALKLNLSHGQYLNSPDSIALISLADKITKMNGKNAGELHRYLENELGFSKEEMMNAETGKTASMKELKNRAKEKFERVKKDVERRVEAQMRTNFVELQDHVHFTFHKQPEPWVHLGPSLALEPPPPLAVDTELYEVPAHIRFATSRKPN
jgi:hypothetical protein